MGQNDVIVEQQAWFSGKVQGVGFRYETLQVAKGFAVTGYVTNLADGRVHLVAHGDGRETRTFVEAVADRMSDFIRDTETREGTANETFAGFTIRQ